MHTRDRPPLGLPVVTVCFRMYTIMYWFGLHLTGAVSDLLFDSALISVTICSLIFFYLSIRAMSEID